MLDTASDHDRAPRAGRDLALALLALAASAALPAPATAAGALPRYRHVVVVIEENRSYSDIIGSADAPWINALAEAGALFTDAHGVEHPSQPNYLDLFSGSDQDVHGDGMPGDLPFDTPNLAAALRARGLTFAIYSEDLPAPGSDVESAPGPLPPGTVSYARKHNPYVNWQPVDPADPQPNAVPAKGNLPFRAFPSDFDRLPTVSFVAPGQANDMHGTGRAGETHRSIVRQGDAWLRQNIDGYRRWALHHDSLLIVTFDEGHGGGSNHVATIFQGAHVRPGRYGGHVNHFDVLRTLEDFYGLPHAGAAAHGRTLVEVFAPAH